MSKVQKVRRRKREEERNRGERKRGGNLERRGERRGKVE